MNNLIFCTRCEKLSDKIRRKCVLQIIGETGKSSFLSCLFPFCGQEEGQIDRYNTILCSFRKKSIGKKWISIFA
jgi:hypothetical protein